MSEKHTKDRKKLSEVLTELKEDYLKKLPAHIELLKKFTAEKNWLLVEEEYHKLKGTGKTYGFPDVSTICEKLEFLAQKPESQDQELFIRAAELLSEMHKSYVANTKLDLNNNSIVKDIMILRSKIKK